MFLIVVSEQSYAGTAPDPYSVSWSTKEREEGCLEIAFEVADPKNLACYTEYADVPILSGSDMYAVQNDTSWKKTITSSYRSVQIMVCNRSAQTLYRKQQTLSSGEWCSIPPEVVPCGSSVEFACKSDSLLSGVEGMVQYREANTGYLFLFEWRNPLWGDIMSDAKFPLLYNVVTTRFDVDASSHVKFVYTIEKMAVNRSVSRPELRTLKK